MSYSSHWLFLSAWVFWGSNLAVAQYQPNLAKVSQGYAPAPSQKIDVRQEVVSLPPGAVLMQQQPIKLSELHEKFHLVGELGYAYQTVLTLTIEIADDTLKGESSAVIVHRVNGTPLAKPWRVEGRIWQHAKPMPKLEPKRFYEVRAFEELEYENGPAIPAMIENKVPVPQAAAASFVERLQIISLIR